MLLIIILKNELKIFLKDKTAICLSIILPLVFIWLVMQAFGPYLAQNRFSSQFAIALVDQDKSVMAKIIVDQFETASQLKDNVQLIRTNQETALTMLQEGKVAGVVILPADFMASVYAGINKPFVLIGNKSQPIASNLLRNELASVANLVSAGQSGIITVWDYTKLAGGSAQLLNQQFQAAVYKFTMSTLGRGRIFSQQTVSAVPKVTAAEYFTAGLLVLTAVFLALQGVNSQREHHQRGLRKRLLASPVQSWQLITAKLLVCFLVAFTQLLVLLLLTKLAFNNYLGGSLVGSLLMITVSALAAASWSCLITVLAPNSQVAMLIGYPGTLLLAIVGGSLYPAVAMPDYLRNLGNYTFTKWSMEGFLKVFAGNPALDLTPDALMVLLTGGFFLIPAVVVFSYTWRE